MKWLLPGLLILLLAACAAPPREVPAEPEHAWAELRERLEAMDTWQAEGRFALRTGNEGGNASFFWREHPGDAFSLRLGGPWGQGTARLSGGNGLARLETGDGLVYHGADAEGLLANLYGWIVPVDELRRWLIGLPVGTDDEGSYSLDRFGRLAAVEWQGWHIDYRRYRQAGDLDLPAELFARHEDRAVEVRVAVDRWRPGEYRDDTPEPDGRIPLIGG